MRPGRWLLKKVIKKVIKKALKPADGDLDTTNLPFVSHMFVEAEGPGRVGVVTSGLEGGPSKRAPRRALKRALNM